MTLMQRLANINWKRYQTKFYRTLCTYEMAGAYRLLTAHTMNGVIYGRLAFVAVAFLATTLYAQASLDATPSPDAKTMTVETWLNDYPVNQLVIQNFHGHDVDPEDEEGSIEVISTDSLSPRIAPSQTTVEQLQNLMTGTAFRAIILERAQRKLNGKAHEFLMPVSGALLTSEFGMRYGRPHNGIDLAAPIGSEILAALPGTVIYSGWEGGYGQTLLVDHGNGLITRYAHCSRIMANVGDKVNPGEAIALVGNTGRSTGPHLHFEVLANGVPRNPLRYIRDKFQVDMNSVAIYIPRNVYSSATSTVKPLTEVAAADALKQDATDVDMTFQIHTNADSHLVEEDDAFGATALDENEVESTASSSGNSENTGSETGATTNASASASGLMMAPLPKLPSRPQGQPIKSPESAKPVIAKPQPVFKPDGSGPVKLSFKTAPVPSTPTKTTIKAILPTPKAPAASGVKPKAVAQSPTAVKTIAAPSASVKPAVVIKPVVKKVAPPPPPVLLEEPVTLN